MQPERNIRRDTRNMKYEQASRKSRSTHDNTSAIIDSEEEHKSIGTTRNYPPRNYPPLNLKKKKIDKKNKLYLDRDLSSNMWHFALSIL